MSHPIEVENLSKHFGKTVAVDDLSFTVREGQVTAFLGSNGAGKTTTIQTILNLHRPNSGSASLFGIDSRKSGPREFRQIGYVSENMELPLWMTVEQYLKYCRPFYPTWDDEFSAQLMEEFQLPHDRKLRNLSRGMRMKAALVGGIAYRPKLVILDEPFSGLDPLVRDEFIRGLLRMTGEQGWTVFLSSHDIEEVERLADRVILIDSGRKRVDETTAGILESCRRVEVYCGEEIEENFSAPEDWHGFRSAGRSASFGISESIEDLEAEIRSQLPEVNRIESHEMSLREVFVMMAAQFRIES
ncbi:MAG: ABC transporter ATP-binding protein [Verrucomicrobiota bacterium]